MLPEAVRYINVLESIFYEKLWWWYVAQFVIAMYTLCNCIVLTCKVKSCRKTQCKSCVGMSSDKYMRIFSSKKALPVSSVLDSDL